MNSTASDPGVSRLRPVNVVAFALVAAGIVLGSMFDLSFLALVAAGAFGPGILRQFGLLKDRDEFQREASVVAGYRAYLVGGTYAAIALVFRPWTDMGSVVEAGKSAAESILYVSLITYLVSYLFHFWGPRTAAFRILLVTGVGMAVYVAVLGAVIELPWLAMVIGALSLSVLLVALAFLSRWFPRVSGLTLVVLTVGGFIYLQSTQPGIPAMAWITRVLFLIPLVASGIGLLSTHPETTEAGSE
jgi:hypothetical protein